MPRVNVKDKRKQQLMEANMASIARRGLTDTTIAHVSKGADMSRGIVNFYFTSKEKMMLETLGFIAQEYTQAWQEALAAKQKETSEAYALIESILKTLTSDKICTNKRMAVWAAFIGHACTHEAYAKIIRDTDETLLQKLKELWQKQSGDAKLGELRARQMQAIIRGHYAVGALSDDDKRPSAYSESWVALLKTSGSVQATAPKEKVIKIKQEVPSRPKKPAVLEVLPGQLDFGDLFSKV